MEKIEKYDILTLDNNIEYAVIQKQETNNNRYLLLAPIDKEEIPNFDELKIVKEIVEDNQVIVEDIDNDELLKTLSAKFLSPLKNEIE